MQPRAPAPQQPRPECPRRGLRRPEAALYVGVSPSKFDEMVKDHRMPQPKLVDGCVIWDVRALDSAFDDLPERDSEGSMSGALDTWADFK